MSGAGGFGELQLHDYVITLRFSENYPQEKQVRYFGAKNLEVKRNAHIGASTSQREADLKLVRLRLKF